MNAFFFCSSYKTLLFSLLFSMLLVLSSAQTPSDDVEQLEPKNLEEFETQEVVEPISNFWPPVHLRGLRSSNGKPTFIRFGKRASPSFIRFGRK